MSAKLSIEDVNKLESNQFVSLFKNVIESWPLAAETIMQKRPFASVNELISHFSEYLENLSVDDKIAVLQTLAELAGKLLDENQLSDESTAEQSSAGLFNLTAEKRSQLIRSNAEYAEKFGFTFVICARLNNKIDRILEGFTNRIPNTRDQEIINGINEVKKICQLRIENIVTL